MSTPDDDVVRVVPYAGEDLRILGEASGLGIARMTIPAHFAGPPPHIHHGFDEALYVLGGTLTMTATHTTEKAVRAGGLILAPRGELHTFANPHDEPAQVLGVWSPGSALEFMEEIGAVLPASGPPDPDALAEVYQRHNSEIVR